MAEPLEWLSHVLPLTYAYDALDHAVRGVAGTRVLRDALIVVGVTIGALALAASTLRRRTP